MKLIRGRSSAYIDTMLNLPGFFLIPPGGWEYLSQKKTIIIGHMVAISIIFVGKITGASQLYPI